MLLGNSYFCRVMDGYEGAFLSVYCFTGGGIVVFNREAGYKWVIWIIQPCLAVFSSRGVKYN